MCYSTSERLRFIRADVAGVAILFFSIPGLSFRGEQLHVCQLSSKNSSIYNTVCYDDSHPRIVKIYLIVHFSRTAGHISMITQMLYNIA